MSRKPVTAPRPAPSSADSFAMRAAVLDAALDAIVTIDEDGMILEFNASAERIFGYRRAEVIGRSMVETLVPPNLREAHSTGFTRHLATGKERIIGHRMEIGALHRDGSTFPVELGIARLELEGRPAFTAYIRDLSDRVATEQRLDAANKRYRDLLESLPIVIYEADFGADGAWRYVSPQIEDMLGFPATDWIEDPNLWFRQIHTDDRDLVLAQEHALRSKPPGERVVSEYRMFTHSGATVWVRDDAVVVLAEGAKPVQMRGVIVDVTERKDLEARLSHHAFYDGLTGLPNRALFMDRLERAIARGRRRSEGVAGVLFLDLDDFKIVNDTLGHGAGDSLLTAIAGRLEDVLRPLGTPARFGGDEFTILLEDVSGPEEALRIAARVGEVCRHPFPIGDRDVVVTASIGIGMAGSESVNAYDLVRQADIAMYRAKENGKARAELFDAEMSVEAWRRLDLQRELREALDKHELVVLYQPIVDLTSGRIEEVEALVRWRHPRRGLLMPSEFVPFAESTGFVSQIDRYVLEEACRQIAEWRKMPSAATLGVAVNLSPRAFRNVSGADEISRVLRDSGLPADCLTLEITESASLLSAGAVPALIDRLSDMGVNVVIDDFGVGYSGLDFVKRFKLNGLKIDRSFVSGLARRREDLAIVTAAIAFGRALGLSVVAEGIETEGQLEQLRQLGCTRGQGYLISTPLEAPVMQRLLSRNRSLLSPARGRSGDRLSRREVAAPPTGIHAA